MPPSNKKLVSGAASDQFSSHSWSRTRMLFDNAMFVQPQPTKRFKVGSTCGCAVNAERSRAKPRQCKHNIEDHKVKYTLVCTIDALEWKNANFIRGAEAYQSRPFPLRCSTALRPGPPVARAQMGQVHRSHQAKWSPKSQE